MQNREGQSWRLRVSVEFIPLSHYLNTAVQKQQSVASSSSTSPAQNVSGHRLREGNFRHLKICKHPDVDMSRRSNSVQKDNITINVVCPGCLPTPAIPQIMRDYFGSKYELVTFLARIQTGTDEMSSLTPISKILDAYTKCLNDSSINGEIIECAADQEFIIPRPPFNSEASKMAGTVYDPLFGVLHGEGSGLPHAQAVGSV
jgi:hypothetical protein